jgi:hypothetical protein
MATGSASAALMSCFRLGCIKLDLAGLVCDLIVASATSLCLRPRSDPWRIDRIYAARFLLFTANTATADHATLLWLLASVFSTVTLISLGLASALFDRHIFSTPFS